MYCASGLSRGNWPGDPFSAQVTGQVGQNWSCTARDSFFVRQIFALAPTKVTKRSKTHVESWKTSCLKTQPLGHTHTHTCGFVFVGFDSWRQTQRHFVDCRAPTSGKALPVKRAPSVQRRNRFERTEAGSIWKRQGLEIWLRDIG